MENLPSYFVCHNPYSQSPPPKQAQKRIPSKVAPSLPLSTIRNPQSIDFIGDVHGYATHLCRLLKLLGYKEKHGLFRHRRRHAVFIGDIINRGPEIRETVRLVYKMVEAGTATLLLGNHEFLALYNHFHPEERRGCPINQKARKQLISTLRAFEKHRTEWKHFLHWIRMRPLFLETPFVRAIHACWDPLALQHLCNNRLLQADFAYPPTQRFWSLWQILEGPHLIDTSAPDGECRARIRWWHTNIPRWESAAFTNKPLFSNRPFPKKRLAKFSPYLNSLTPLFIGHYGFPKPPKPLTGNLCCIDMGVAQTGQLAAYSWDGEQTLSATKLVSVKK